MTVVGYAGGLAIKKCTSASALSPQLLLVRRESGCTGVYRSDSLDTLMQEERRAQFPQNMADSRSRRQELVEPEACAT